MKNDFVKIEISCDENNEIQRFYTPITCEKCTIYNKCKDCKLSKCPEML